MKRRLLVDVALPLLIGIAIGLWASLQN